MKLPILIVRTVSVEKLAPTLEACCTRWPGHPLLVVTSSSRAAELRGDPRIAEIVPYSTGVRGFESPVPYAHALEAVVVPVGNDGGSGYANVLRACRALNSRTWFLASYARDLRQLGPWSWSRRWRTEVALQALARLLGHLWGIWLCRRLTAASRDT